MLNNYELLVILIMLLEGEKHGYLIKEEVLNETQGKIRISFTTLYRHFNYLLKIGLSREVTHKFKHTGHSHRRYYEITEKGIEAVDTEIDHLNFLLTLAKKKLADNL